jgi:hypothetical protein
VRYRAHAGAHQKCRDHRSQRDADPSGTNSRSRLVWWDRRQVRARGSSASSILALVARNLLILGIVALCAPGFRTATRPRETSTCSFPKKMDA